MSKTLFISCLLLFSASVSALANPEDIIRFDLALGGYRLGMNYEEAVNVRPFAHVENYRSHPDLPEITAGYVDQIYVEGTEFRFKVEFIDEQVFKIIGRFSPTEIRPMRETLVRALGEGESKSQTNTTSAGIEYLLIHDHWEFPQAKLDLIGSELNTDFATLAMTSNSREFRERGARFRDAATATATAGAAQNRP